CREAVLPIRTFRTLALDPLTSLVGALQDVRDGETAVLQVCFTRTAYPWGESMVRAVSDAEGHAFFADAPEMLPLAREKASRLLFACALRVGARAASRDRAFEIARAVGRALSVFSDPAGNELLALSNAGYPDESHAVDVVTRQSRRAGMILSAA